MAEPLAIAKNFALSAVVTFPQDSAMLSGTDKAALFNWSFNADSLIE